MSATANFKVDPRLASILGESYRSSEYALKELIDNAWDAEATEVRITVPTILSEDPIIIEDDGSGMKPAEVRDEYAQRIAAGVVHRYCASIGPRDSGLRAFRELPNSRSFAPFAGNTSRSCVSRVSWAESLPARGFEF